jgi:conjugative transfer signal peptidase TraF
VGGEVGGACVAPRRGLAGRAVAVAVVLLLASISGLRLTYNTTPSLPVGIYRIAALEGAPRRGDFVGFCLEGDMARLALDRGYVHRQALEPYVYRVRCASGAAAIGKPVAGVPGDTVDLGRSGVRINGLALPRGLAAGRDSRGRPMPRPRSGRRVLGPGEYWLQSTYSRWSLDSRYIGPVWRGQIVDVRVPVFVQTR